MTVHISTQLRNALLGLRTNVLNNASFTTDASGWTAVASSLASVASGLSGNCLQITNSGAAPGSAYQDFTTVVGKVYVVSVPFKKGTGAGGTVYIGNSSNRAAIFTGPLMTSASWPSAGPMASNAPAPLCAFVATATSTRITLENTDSGSGTTALFDEVLVRRTDSGYREIMRDCYVTFFTGAQPANADSAMTGTPLFTTTLNGDGVTGLNCDDASAGSINKGVSEQWQGTSVAAGPAGCFRVWVAGDNPQNASTAYPRWDGAVAASGAEVNTANPVVDNGAIQTIPAFTITIPA